MTDQVKAREFILTPKEATLRSDFHCLEIVPGLPKEKMLSLNLAGDNSIHAIEKSFFDAVVRERDELKDKDREAIQRELGLCKDISVKDAEIRRLKLHRLALSNLKSSYKNRIVAYERELERANPEWLEAVRKVDGTFEYEENLVQQRDDPDFEIKVIVAKDDEIAKLKEELADEEQHVKEACAARDQWLSTLRENSDLKRELDRHKELLRVQCNRSQDLRDAMEKSLEHLEIFNFAKDPVRVAYADTIIRTALGGEDESILHYDPLASGSATCGANGNGKNLTIYSSEVSCPECKGKIEVDSEG